MSLPAGLRGGPIYLDYNAATPIDPRVTEACLPYLGEHFGNPSSGHAYGRAARAAVTAARRRVAELVDVARSTRRSPAVPARSGCRPTLSPRPPHGAPGTAAPWSGIAGSSRGSNTRSTWRSGSTS